MKDNINEIKDDFDNEDHLTEECEFVGELLKDFDDNNVNAFVILEMEGEAMCVMSNGISKKALITFLFELSEDDPELYSVVNILREYKKNNGTDTSDRMVH